MKRMLACAALLALAGIHPAVAERLYVPVLGGAADGSTLATSVWATSTGAGPAVVRAAGLDAAGPRAAREYEVPRGAQVLGDLVAPGAEGLVALDAAPDSVSAWVATGEDGDDVAEVPVIGAEDTYHPGATPSLALGDDDSTAVRVGAANLGDAAATCTATLVGADGNDSGSFTLNVPAHGLAHRDLAAGERAGATSARVGCDQQFFPLAVSKSSDLQVIVAEASGPNGHCDRTVALTRQADGSWFANLDGVFHQATGPHPKGIVCVSAPSNLRIGRAVYEWDVVAGPWWPKRPNGIHNLGYFFGQRYHSGVIGNVNSTGTKGTLRIMQNYSMRTHRNTHGDASYRLTQGSLYHAAYTFDASGARATLRLEKNGGGGQTVSTGTSPSGRTLAVKPYGSGGLALVAEFGNYNNPRMPEVPTIGWAYANFRLRLYPK